MNRVQLKRFRRIRRKHGIRHRVFGVPNRPRLSIFRMPRHMYGQVIDDLSGRTLASAATNEKAHPAENGGNVEAAKAIGQRIAERAREAGIETVVFDRNGFRYHGRVKAVADAAREGGLKF